MRRCSRGTAPTPTRTSELGECIVVQNHEFYDFEAKYLAEGDVRLETARPTCRAEVADEVRRLAAAGVRGAGCEGLARVDFFLTETGDVLVNEINTMPGFTPHSMYPRMWAATRAELPRAHRRADRAGAGAPHRPALTASQLSRPIPEARPSHHDCPVRR